MFLITEINYEINLLRSFIITVLKRSHSGSASDFRVTYADGTFSVINYAKHSQKKRTPLSA